MIASAGLKLVRMLAILLMVSAATFFLLELVPGDPVASILGVGASPEEFEKVRLELGLDRPASVRYFEWLGNVVTGDFGRSLFPPVQDVSTIIAARLPVTLEVAVVALVLAFVIAVPTALWSAQRVGRLEDAAISAGTSAAVSVPSFLSALLLIYAFVFQPGLVTTVVAALGVAIVLSLFAWAVPTARRRRSGQPLMRAAMWGAGVLVVTAAIVIFFPDFPRQGYSKLGDGGLGENLRSVFLPALSLALLEGAVFARVLRNDLINTLNEDFILSARAKGMPNRWVLFRHALRPSSMSLVTVAGVSFGRLLGGTVIVETIFRLPGMGSLLVKSIYEKNFPVVQATILLIAVIYVVMNTLVDISYTALDPRLRRVRA